MNTNNQEFMGKSFAPCLMRTLAAISTGKPIKEVAALLGISTHTFNDYLRTCKLKLGVNLRSEVMAITLTNGFNNMGDYNGIPLLAPKSDSPPASEQ